MNLPQTTVGLPNHDGKSCGPGDLTTLQHALEISCNTAFGWLGLKVGPDALRDQAAKFGFGESLRIPMRVSPSTFPAAPNAPQTAQSAIGQYDVRVTPLQVAMVTAAIANRGIVMRPYLVQQVIGANLEILDSTEASAAGAVGKRSRIGPTTSSGGSPQTATRKPICSTIEAIAGGPATNVSAPRR